MIKKDKRSFTSKHISFFMRSRKHSNIQIHIVNFQGFTLINLIWHSAFIRFQSRCSGLIQIIHPYLHGLKHYIQTIRVSHKLNEDDIFGGMQVREKLRIPKRGDEEMISGMYTNNKQAWIKRSWARTFCVHIGQRWRRWRRIATSSNPRHRLLRRKATR